MAAHEKGSGHPLQQEHPEVQEQQPKSMARQCRRAGKHARRRIRYHRRLIPRLLQTKSDGMLDAIAKKRESLINAPTRRGNGGRAAALQDRGRGTQKGETGTAEASHLCSDCLSACTWDLQTSPPSTSPHPLWPTQTFMDTAFTGPSLGCTKNCRVASKKGRGQKATTHRRKAGRGLSCN